MQEHHVRTPGPDLAPFVSRISGYRLTGFEPGTHVGMPSPCLTVVVPFDDPIVVSAPGGEPRSYTALASGLHDRAVGIHHEGSQHGIQLDLTPAGARALLGLPAGVIAGQLVELGDLLGPADQQLAEQAAEQPHWRARIDVVLTALTRRLVAGTPATARPEVSHAWDEIRRTRGRVPVGSVASSVGWSTRHLGEQFRAEYGVSPKRAASITRFDRAHRLVAAGRPLADAALACGYADQAHLNREWRAFVGVSPTRWLADDDLAFVQDRDRPSA